MHHQEVERIATCAPRLEVGKQRLWCYVSVKNIHVSEFPHPCVFDDDKDELRSLSPRCLVGAAVGSLGFVRCFCARMNDVHGIIVNRRVVSANSCGFNELCALAHCVRCHRPNEDDEVVCASRFIVRSLEEERRHDLLDSRELGVRWLAVYWIELFERIGEFCHDLFGRHGFRRAWLRDQFGYLQRQVPSTLALIIHRKK